MKANCLKSDLSKINVLILCGGIGSRLAPLVSDRPKCLAEIRGRPFLDTVLENLIKSGFRRIIFCVGHLSNQVMNHYSPRDGVEFLFSNEDHPLGTGGAIKNALNLVDGPSMLVLNGDSFCQIDYEKLINFHNRRDSDATLVLIESSDRGDVGFVSLDEDHKIESFSEKDQKRGGALNYINAGIYLLNVQKFRFDDFNPPFSIELDVFPNLIKLFNFYGFIVNSKLIDIGTPERYAKANRDGLS